jgi:acyl-coenzyme A synthetase/AMP-(fatty) acid ligase
VRIVRHGGDADEMVKPGEAGELIVDASAETFFSGYLNRPDATAEKLRNGWYFTGDVCVMHENGDMDLVGLVDDVIRSGAKALSPGVEALLASHPSVRGPPCLVSRSSMGRDGGGLRGSQCRAGWQA